ncbi:MAG: peptidylprolyl isomerase [Bacteroidales bacterium]|nr:peptidylprolyl isomerase [Bacteroidales bacterium]
MRIVRFIVSVALLLGANAVCAQNAADPVVFEIGGKKICKSEFMKDYLQSMSKTTFDGMTAAEKHKSLMDYAELYVNFRCKLADAYALGYDTLPELKRELMTYRKELAAPYLIDSATMNASLREAYERNKYALHAAHVLVPVAQDASPADTMKALREAENVYKRLMAGEDIYAVAQEIVAKNNPDYRPNPMEGELGTFTVFNMIYPFESAAYSLEPGQISKPVRTRYGYHVIKLFSKVKYYGRPTIAHIWLRSDVDSLQSAYGIQNFYQRLLDGEKFERVARGSDDMNTAGKGGELKSVEMNRIPPEYVVNLSELKEGEFSKPFHTTFGWHIVKLVKADSLPPFEQMLPYYKQRFSRDQRAKAPQDVFVANAKEKYHFVDNTVEEYKIVKKKKVITRPATASLAEVRSLLTDSVFSGTWECPDELILDRRPLFTLGDTAYTAVDFVHYLLYTQQIEAKYSLDTYLNDKYKRYIDGRLIFYADDHLEQEYPEFAELVDSYRHGLMIFKYNDTMVWSKAIYDTVGFNEFYKIESRKKNINDTSDAVYFWRTRARLKEVTVDDSVTLAPKKASRLIFKGLKKGWGSTDLKEALEAAADKSRRGQGRIEVAADIVEQGNQTIIKDTEWSVGVYSRPNGKGYKYIIVERILEPSLKELSEARGFYLNEYQNEVERRQSQKLRQRYNVTINKDVLDQITY